MLRVEDPGHRLLNFRLCKFACSTKRSKAGDLIGVSGKFGIQQAGLLLLLNRAKSSEQSFSKSAVDSVLEPNARLDVGLKVSRYLSSCIDSSDGLAISLYHLAESSKEAFVLNELPIHSGVGKFATENGLLDSELVLFGGEEYQLVCTYRPQHESSVLKFGVSTIGVVKESHNKRYQVPFGSERNKQEEVGCTSEFENSVDSMASLSACSYSTTFSSSFSSLSDSE